MAGANAFARESANSNRQPLAQRKRKTISCCNNFTDAHRVGYATANRRCNCDSVANCISDVFTFAIAIGATFKGNHSKLGI